MEVFGGTPAPLSDQDLGLTVAWTEFWANAALENDTVVGGPAADMLIVAAFENTEALRSVCGDCYVIWAFGGFSSSAPVAVTG